MKKISIALIFTISINLFSEVEILNRVAVIVDDGVIMESQIKNSLQEMITRYDDQNIAKPPLDVMKVAIIENLIIEELQLQMADRAGIKISDTELNGTVSRIAGNNKMELQEFISFMQEDGASYEDFREQVRKEMTIQRIQRGRVGSEVGITEKEFDAYLATDESLINLEPELLVRQIQVETAKQADSIIKKLDDGEDFE